MPSPALIRCLTLAVLAVSAGETRAAADCDAPPASWQPRSAVQALAERNGWKVERLKIDDGCYELKGHDAEGRPFRAKVDPSTLQVLRLRRGEHGQREGERRRERRSEPAASMPTPSSSGAHE